MTDAAALELRHVRLAEPVTLRPAPLGPTPQGTVEEGVFVALDDSPPVRTVLTVVEGERRRALEVAWVVEVAERDDEPRGFYGRWVGDEALERAAKVGTEHLEDGMPVVQPVIHDDNSVVLDVSDTGVMAMPAPVLVLDDDTGVVDVDDEGDGGSGERRIAASEQVEESAARVDDGAGGDSAQAYAGEGGDSAQHAGDSVGHAGHDDSVESASGSYESDEGDEGSDADDASEASEADSDASEASSDAGEAASEAGDPGESRTRGRKKRRRRR